MPHSQIDVIDNYIDKNKKHQLKMAYRKAGPIDPANTSTL
jgi:hypothetical protein